MTRHLTASQLRHDRYPCDCLGTCASLACAVHCAAMPFVIGFLPAMGLTWLAGEGPHRWMAGICLVFALAAFAPAYRRHRRLAPALVGATGVFFLFWSAFGMPHNCCAHCTEDASPVADTVNSITDVRAEERCPHCTAAECTHSAAEEQSYFASESSPYVAPLAPWLTPLGGVLLVVGHLTNRHCSKCCR
jgi:hypothetical protein